MIGVGFSESDVEVVAGHAGHAYGLPHAATIEAIKLEGALEALPVDPVYSGKGLAGLIALVRSRRWQPDDDVIFVHTGGTPALFAIRACWGSNNYPFAADRVECLDRQRAEQPLGQDRRTPLSGVQRVKSADRSASDAPDHARGMS
jgi:hypothetical protein